MSSREHIKFKLDCFNHIIELIPNGIQVLEELHAVKDGIWLFVKYMQKKASSAWSDDTKALKKEIACYLPNSAPNNIITPLPISDDPQTFMENVRNSIIKIKEREFPTFLYEETIPYDPDNKDAVLAADSSHTQTYQHIITGPSTALNPKLIKVKNSHCKSEKIVLTRSDPYTIGYAVYYLLADAENWGLILSNGYNLQDLYNRVVDFLADKEDLVVKEIMEWYDKECHFHELRDKLVTKESETEMDTGDDLEEICPNTSEDHHQLLPINPQLLRGSTGDPDNVASPGVYQDDGEDLSTRQTSLTNMHNAHRFSTISPNNFIRFDRNSNTFIIPHSADNLQALNSFMPPGFRIQGVDLNNSLFYMSSSINQSNNSTTNWETPTSDECHSSVVPNSEDELYMNTNQHSTKTAEMGPLNSCRPTTQKHGGKATGTGRCSTTQKRSAASNDGTVMECLPQKKRKTIIPPTARVTRKSKK
ncbi:hypothetical protein APHAL10511_008409 [Amanita phalloides]|nr:hypothetical protein APHAL10511_008409 [Amanita phalloides]